MPNPYDLSNESLLFRISIYAFRTALATYFGLTMVIFFQLLGWILTRFVEHAAFQAMVGGVGITFQ